MTRRVFGNAPTTDFWKSKEATGARRRFWERAIKLIDIKGSEMPVADPDAVGEMLNVGKLMTTMPASLGTPEMAVANSARTKDKFDSVLIAPHRTAALADSK
jgi:hypothetical protein